MGSRLTLNVPSDYVLARDVCSYGYFILAPNHWDVPSQTLARTLEANGDRVDVRIAQPAADTASVRQRAKAARGRPLRIVCSRRLDRSEQLEVKQQITRMLNLADDGVRAFHRVDPRWKKAGRGRLFRSPTMFEDVIKTVTSCNVNWPSTIKMNKRLCEVVNPAFPRAGQLARMKPAKLRARCGVGYRDQRIVDLAKLFDSGDVDPAWFDDVRTPDEDVERALLALPGIGPYAASNIMQLLGRYSRLALDTESVRHAKVVLGMDGTDAELHKRLHAHYEPFGAHKFRSYWFELWDYYERVKGPAHTWDRDTTGTEFTAAMLNTPMPGSVGAHAGHRKKRASHKRTTR